MLSGCLRREETGPTTTTTTTTTGVRTRRRRWQCLPCRLTCGRGECMACTGREAFVCCVRVLLLLERRRRRGPGVRLAVSEGREWSVCCVVLRLLGSERRAGTATAIFSPPRDLQVAVRETAEASLSPCVSVFPVSRGRCRVTLTRVCHCFPCCCCCHVWCISRRKRRTRTRCP